MKNIAKKRTHHIPMILILLVLAFSNQESASAHDQLKRGGVDQVATDLQISRFSLDLTVGVAGIEDAGGTLTISPRFELHRGALNSLALSLPVIWIPEGRKLGSAPRFGTTARFTTHQGVSTYEQSEVARPVVEQDSSWIFAPSLEWTYCTDGCARPSIFVGAGVRHDERSSPLTEVDDATRAVLTFGLSVERAWKKKSALRVEFRMLTTFYEDDPGRLGGGAIGADGPTTSFIASAGLRLKPLR